MDHKKRYSDALERARYYHSKDYMLINSAIENIFPELKEPEDEKMRKMCIRYLDWEYQHCYCNEDKTKIEKCIAWLEKQGEQKPSDKSEPKFHEGEWITDGYVGGQITSIEENYPCYKIVDFMGINTSIPFTIQDNYHLWTIQDAKDGDVLAYVTDEEDLWIMIYWSLYEPYEGHVHYHALLVNNDFSDKGTCCICINNLKPAAKEQRDLLFQKMKDAGYEWDAEKKELKKMEVTSKESEDEKVRKALIELVKYAKGNCLELLHKPFNVVSMDAMLAWLEKQGEQTQLDYEHADIPQKDFAPIEHKTLNADEVIAWLVANICDYKYYVKLFKKDFKL